MALRDLQSIGSALGVYFDRKPEVDAAYIFGSLAAGRVRPDSDIDIAVLVSEKVRRDLFRYRLKMMAELMDVLKRTDVDLVLLNQAPPLLAHRVLKKGRLVFERSASARIAFQVRTVNRYLDTQPMRDLYLEYLKQHARQGSIFG
jgi:predicted nucleotidyltransferase